VDRLSAPEQNRLLAGLSNLLRRMEQDTGPEFLPRGLDVMGLVRQLALPSAETVEKLSYGDPLFRMPQQSNIPITTDRGYVSEVLGMAPAIPAASRATTRISNEMADQLVRAITGNPQATAPGALEAAGQMAPLARMFKPEQVKAVLPDTKVVDEAGNPKLLYHGTNRDYEQFSESNLGEKTGNPTSRMGFFFSESPEEASRYTMDWGKEGGNVRPVYLDIKNPKRLTYKQMDDISMAMFDESSFLPDNAWKTKEGRQAIVESKEKGIKKANQMALDLRDQLISEGYDGAVVKIGGKDEYIAFSQDQIKSATSDPAFAGLLEPEAVKFEMPSFARAIPETSEEIDRIYDYLEDQAKKAGFKVRGGSSNVSGSRYLTIVEDLPDDDVRDIQVRISNHGDRHPFTEASEGKISIDPSMGGTDLEQTLYQLQDKGFNLIK